MADLEGSDRHKLEKRLILAMSTVLLLAAFCVAMVFKRFFINSTGLIVTSFLLPAIATGLAAVFFDKIRFSSAAFALSFLLSVSSFQYAVALESPDEVKLVIACSNLVWGSTIQMAVDLAAVVDKSELDLLPRILAGTLSLVFQFPLIYGLGALHSIKSLQTESSGGWNWAWACPVPILLGCGMIWLIRDFSAARSAARSVASASEV